MKLWLKTSVVLLTLGFFGGIAGAWFGLLILATALWLVGLVG